MRRGVGMIPGHRKAARWCLLWCSNEAYCVYKMTAKYAGSEMLRRGDGSLMKNSGLAIIIFGQTCAPVPESIAAINA